ncbi:NAD-dependent epimerase [Pseudomonas sp. 1D4]|uniref:NAD-dependent epimerase/dehydratase family protein n=1 Tax=Pseudomonadaceae TaxID=135621 RepID=UPI00084AD90D|nr:MULTISPECIES: NAD-dependent epimerase/dehydratase family protein [Pseudomonas]OEC40027.1 NAD-dependent epimerase [Pseudomonas sp. 1D4]
MKVLLIGGTGFIGKKLLLLLLGAGHEVRVLSRKTQSDALFDNSRVEWKQLDLLDLNCDLDAAISGCSLIFNCAGELHNEGLMEALHVDATARLLDACKRRAEASGHTLHWVQLSSVGAYGSPVRANLERTITEESMLAPRGVYEVSKTRADSLVISSAQPGLMTVSILRPSNIFGAGMPNGSLRQWGRIIRRRCFFYVGEPGAISTYVHVDDVVEALMLCGFESVAQGQVFNLSNDCPQEVLVNAMARHFGVAPPFIRLPESLVRVFAMGGRRLAHYPLTQARIDSLVARTHYDCRKLEVVLGYRPRRAISDCIGEVFAHDEVG